MTPFIISLKPGGNIKATAHKLATLIVDRWMPNNRQMDALAKRWCRHRGIKP